MKNKLKLWFTLLFAIIFFIVCFGWFYQVQNYSSATISEFNGVQILQTAVKKDISYYMDQTIELKINQTTFKVDILQVSQENDYYFIYLDKWIYNLSDGDSISIKGDKTTLWEYVFNNVF